MPAVNDVGEPCAGEPHARFDGRGLETRRKYYVGAPAPDPTRGREIDGLLTRWPAGGVLSG
jgi:hypothetical protein